MGDKGGKGKKECELPLKVTTREERPVGLSQSGWIPRLNSQRRLHPRVPPLTSSRWRSVDLLTSRDGPSSPGLDVVVGPDDENNATVRCGGPLSIEKSFAGAVVIATPRVTRASNGAGDCGGFF